MANRCSVCLAVLSLSIAGRLVSAAVISLADPEPIGPDHPAPFTYVSGVHQINVMVAGDEPIRATDARLFLGDGGSAVDGEDTSPPHPAFIDLVISAAGHVFGPTDPTAIILADDLAIIHAASTISGTRSATGILASALIDMSAAAPGRYLLSPFLITDPQIHTAVYDAQGEEVPSELSLITITIVPEPASVLLLVTGVGIGFRRRGA